MLFLSYTCIGFFLSSQVVKFDTRTLTQEKDRLHIKNVSDFGLPNPESFNVPSNEITISGWIFYQERRQCAIIFSHGHAGNRYGMLKYTTLFQDKNCALFLIDSRYHGESGGEYGTYGYYEKEDLVKVAQWIESKMSIPINKIGLVGESYGASISILAASIDSKFWFVLADSPYKDLKTALMERSEEDYTKFSLLFTPIVFFFTEKRANFLIDDVSPEKYVTRTQTPIFLVHSKQDIETYPHHSEDIYRNISIVNKKLLMTDWNAKHTKSIDVNFTEYKKELNTFLNTLQ
jgi:dipeptidyl aminopeptidase/acylaminoacyl peptidase